MDPSQYFNIIRIQVFSIVCLGWVTLLGRRAIYHSVQDVQNKRESKIDSN